MAGEQAVVSKVEREEEGSLAGISMVPFEFRCIFSPISNEQVCHQDQYLHCTSTYFIFPYHHEFTT
jgi:hypothetical protein